MPSVTKKEIMLHGNICDTVVSFLETKIGEETTIDLKDEIMVFRRIK